MFCLGDKIRVGMVYAYKYMKLFCNDWLVMESLDSSLVFLFYNEPVYNLQLRRDINQYNKESRRKFWNWKVTQFIVWMSYLMIACKKILLKKWGFLI